MTTMTAWWLREAASLAAFGSVRGLKILSVLGSNQKLKLPRDKTIVEAQCFEMAHLQENVRQWFLRGSEVSSAGRKHKSKTIIVSHASRSSGNRNNDLIRSPWAHSSHLRECERNKFFSQYFRQRHFSISEQRRLPASRPHCVTWSPQE